MTRFIVLLIIFLLTIISPAGAVISFKSFVNCQDDVVDFTERLRLEFDRDLPYSAYFNLQYEIVGYAGRGLESVLVRQILKRPKPYYLGLDGVVADEKDYLVTNRVDRLYLQWQGFTVGRDAVSFGVGRVWSPMDIFEPFAPTEIDKENKTGVDIVKYDFGLTGMSDVAFVFAPTQEGKSTSAVRLRGTFFGFTTSFLAAQIKDETNYGLSFDGPVLDAGFRGELNHAVLADGSTRDRYIIGSDYMFNGDLYVVAEYYFNGFGSNDPLMYDWMSYLSGNTLSLAENYLALGGSYDFWSLWNVNGYIISNLDDGSRLYWKEVQYSLSDNSSVHGGMMITSGSELSEYAVFKPMYYLLLSFYF